MKFICIFLFIIMSLLLHAQNERYLKITGGRVLFGTGDVPGYGIYTEYSFRLGKLKQSYWKHFQLSGEFGFETGAIQPASINPPPSDYQRSFYHISSSLLYAKLNYYPISSTFLKGLNVSLGPTGGYYLSSRTGSSILSFLPDGSITQVTYLDYDNHVFIGYKITAGYEYYFKKWLVGARLDWSNNQKGDINTMYGAKLGWKL